MPDFSVLILCGRSPRHLYVANKLCEVARPVAILQETGSDFSADRIFQFIKRPNVLANKVWRWLRDRRRYVGNGEARYFFGDAVPCLTRPELVAEVPHINHPNVVALVDKHQPDMIAVFGTSLIKGKLLERKRLGIINLHGGLSPHYRGADCTFWALYNREPDKVGCTLHFIDAGIDTGGLIAHVCPEVRESDDELTLFWRAVRDSAGVYAELLARLKAGERFGQSQHVKGKLYQVKHRLWRHERALERRLQQGLLAGVNLPRRITWYSKDDRFEACSRMEPLTTHQHTTEAEQ